MCGRLVTTSSPSDIANYFGALTVAERLLNREPNFNVAPTTELAVVMGGGTDRRLEPTRWGLVPSWAQKASIGSRMINARIETVAEKPSFRRAFVRRRCIVPADGFYEWKATGSTPPKQPFFIYRRDHEPLAFAGLWETWRDPNGSADQDPLTTCTILTGPATGEMAEIHDRMPVMVGPDFWDRWLDESLHEPQELLGLLGPCPDDLLGFRRVSTAVNNARNKGAELLIEVDAASEATEGNLLEPDDGQQRLF